jgi:nitrous oxide reductase
VDQRFHVIQVALERTPACRCQSKFCFRQPSVKRFVARDIVSLFQATRVDAQISIGRLQKRFQLIKGERVVDSERAYDAESHAFVNQTVKVRRNSVGVSADRSQLFVCAARFRASFLSQCTRFSQRRFSPKFDTTISLHGDQPP